MNRRRFFLFSGLGAAGLLSSCGYHVGGRADLVPKSIQTIAIPAFQNSSVRYKLTDQLPRYIAREFITRTRFKIEDDPSVADAVLNGTVNAAVIYPTVYDPLSGKATSMQ
ncbi:MAG TPA: LPS assembly lipoprotein LptE, partial [Bryobacteraceae bacterium]